LIGLQEHKEDTNNIKGRKGREFLTKMVLFHIKSKTVFTGSSRYRQNASEGEMEIKIT
jgi:hypothetical protein